jgi:hypothetical protein
MSFLCYTRGTRISKTASKKVIKNNFLTDFYDFKEKKNFFNFFIRVPPFDQTEVNKTLVFKTFESIRFVI